MPPETSTDPSERNLLRRRASRRAVLAGGVAAVGVAGAYAALGDPLALFGSSGSDGAVSEAVRGDTAAISQESVRINHLLRRTGFGVTGASTTATSRWACRTTLDELLNYDRIDDGEAECGDAEGREHRPAADRHQLAGAHGDDEAAVAGKDDPLLARPADQPAQRRA